MELLDSAEWDERKVHAIAKKAVDMSPSDVGKAPTTKDYIMVTRQLIFLVNEFKSRPGNPLSLPTNEMKYVCGLIEKGSRSDENITQIAEKIRDLDPDTFQEELKIDHYVNYILLLKKILDHVKKGHQIDEDTRYRILSGVIFNFLHFSERETAKI